MKNYPILFLLLIMLALAACAEKSDKPAKLTADDIRVTDPDQAIEVKGGEEFTIMLETNPNTGLHWEIAVELDTAVVEYVWKEFVGKTAREDSPGWDVWTFKAIAPGETTITFGYYRGFTEDSTKTAEFKIIVK